MRWFMALLEIRGRPTFGGLPLALSATELQNKLSLPALTAHPADSSEPFFTFAVPGKSAIQTWSDLQKSAPALGYWPVVLGEPENLDRIVEAFDYSDAPSASQTLTQAAALDVQNYFEQRAREFSDQHAHGTWPASPQRMTDFTIPRKILAPRDFHPAVNVALVPAMHSWDVAARLNIGGWNDCPLPHEHVAVHHYWNQVYGAEIVGYSGDVVEMRVARSPASREEALKLAQEQYWYCYDIVEQGVGTIENLAAGLMAGDIWYFWWD